ncbi:hypothetical protein HYDPIDRAFT_161884 [Hydnomerulius pinastri MD-312]|uniref:BZIP domain-containing protein n=1 Tax=Hydnomerulius pinastri MD-312 TaxID=994086 RepID=A0A0C9W9X1_9AGAM|nr:hypothetical protein HYDPIDRAFT_161884 [Hydnomerulius pinastri MD-312]
MDYPSLNSLWDLAQAPSQFSQLPDDDFLALLQKQFPTSITELNSTDPNDGSVNPQSIQKQQLPLPGLTPPSDDSSPSPPSNNDSHSRRQSVYSRGNDNEEGPALKRKASDDDMDEGPSSKNQHTVDDSSNAKKGSASRRKSTGNQQDESRLMKRKEQNRAAQRAFRERKEKHVKDLEDKVAALEAKNEEAVTENTNLRDLLSRLQQENLALKQAQFTFSVPKPAQVSTPASTSSVQQSPFSFFNTASSVSPAAGPSQPSPKPPAFGGDIDWGSLTTFDPNMLSMLDEPDVPMQMDYTNSPYGQYALPQRYKTIATNPLLMSFADTPETPISATSNTSSGSTFDQFNFNFPSPSNSWTSTAQSPAFTQNQAQSDFLHQNHSLDELFGGNYMGNQGPLDFSALVEQTSLSAVSPVSHANASGKSISPHNSISSPPSGTNSSSSPSSASTSNGQSPFSWTMSRAEESPPSASEATPSGTCGPRMFTREDIAKHIVASGESPFTSPPSNPALHKATDFDAGNIIACKGANFPKTQESPQNIEVLKAWRTITSNPHFKDADINELCTEFTKKARCDGTKVVLEPEGVHHIIETFKSKQKQQMQQQQHQQDQKSQ